MVQDKANGTIRDLRISPVKSATLSLSYYTATLFSTLIICFAATGICLTYVAIVGWNMLLADIFFLFLDILLLVLFGTALSSIINFFLSTQGQISAVGTIISAGYGFICGAYMPISSFGKGLQKIISFLPGTYGTSLIRNHTMQGALAEIQNQGIPIVIIEKLKDSLDCNLYFFGSQVNIGTMVNILDEELARYPDVIAVASVAEDASAVQFDLAAENGIAVVAFDSRNNYQGIQCTCMTDNVAAAKEGARKMSEAIEEKGEILLIAQDSVSGTAKERTKAVTEEITANYPNVKVVETIYMDQFDDLKMQAAADELGVTKEQLAEWTVESSGQTPADEGEEAMSEEVRTKLEDIRAVADGMTDADVVAPYMEKYPNLKGCFAVNADAVLLAMDAFETAENEEDIVLMGFDAGKEQIAALKNGTIDGLIVQNPFGMGYATVVAAARAALEIGNEATVDTGYVWVDKENMDDPDVKGMLYE